MISYKSPAILICAVLALGADLRYPAVANATWQWDAQGNPFSGARLLDHNSATAVWTDYPEATQRELQYLMPCDNQADAIDVGGGRRVAIVPAGRFNKRGLEYVQAVRALVRGREEWRVRPVRFLRAEDTPAAAPSAVDEETEEAEEAWLAGVEGEWSPQSAGGFVYGEAAFGAGMAASQVDGDSQEEHPLYRSARSLARIFNRCGVDEDQETNYCPGDWPTALVQACEHAVSADPAGAQETLAKYRGAYEEICRITRETPDTARVFGELITA